MSSWNAKRKLVFNEAYIIYAIIVYVLMIVLRDEPFDACYMHYDEHRYMEFFESKVTSAKESFGPLIQSCTETQLFSSAPKHFRQRCRFAIFQKSIFEIGVSCDGTCDSGRKNDVWYPLKQSCNQCICYGQWSDGCPCICIENFPPASETIQICMRPLLEAIADEETDHLHCGLQAINFLSTLHPGSIIVTLVYSSAARMYSSAQIWQVRASLLRSRLETVISASNSADPSDISVCVIGRAKGIKIVCGEAYIIEKFRLSSDQLLRYRLVEDGFSNPNAGVNRLAMQWMQSIVKSLSGHDFDDSGCACTGDILELYCGNGNHTVAIASHCRRVLAVELNPSLCAAARDNLCMNGITNAEIVNCASEHMALRLMRQRRHRSTATGIEYNFSTALLDPPRAGLDDVVIESIRLYDSIIYISCSPQSLRRDLLKVC